METQLQPAQLPVQEANYPQTTAGQPVVLAPGQQLMYAPPGQPGVGQPVYVQGQVNPGQPPPQYQAPGQPGVPVSTGQPVYVQGPGTPGQPTPQYQAPRQPQFGFRLTLDLNYLKTPPAVLKYVEMVSRVSFCAINGTGIAHPHRINRSKRNLNPFTPKSDQFQISPAASPEISHHTV